MLGYIEIVRNHTSDLDIHESWYLYYVVFGKMPH